MKTYDFTTMVDFYDTRDVLGEDGKPTGEKENYIVRKDIKITNTIKLNLIDRYGEVITEKARVRKGYTKLYLSTGDMLVVKGTQEEVKEILTPKQIGFQYGRQ